MRAGALVSARPAGARRSLRWPGLRCRRRHPVSASTASAQDPFPDGPGKDVTVRICGTCHPSARGAAVRLTREGWQDVIAKMVSLGAKGTDEELAAVLDYLSTTSRAMRPSR